MLRRKRGATPRLRCCQAGPENVSLKLSLAPNLVAQPARRIAERESGRQAAFRVPQLVELGQTSEPERSLIARNVLMTHRAPA